MKQFKKIVGLFALSALFLSSCNQEETYYTKQAVFPEGATLEEKLEIASHVVPLQKQLEWQQLERTVFFHFGVNTFTGREWGDGTEDPNIFNPTELNTDQWVQTVKDAGFKLVILTAKHHDGFCLWPTNTTKHSVASSMWKDGKGDVVRELRNSCDKIGMKFGIYLSPWDRNASCYGTDEYNDFFVAQLTELLTNYGQVDEVWFDGACGEGPNGKKQVYDFEKYYAVIDLLMPNAVVAIKGDDVRWVGNESGLGRETEWSVTPIQNSARPEAVESNTALGLDEVKTDVGSRDLIAKAKSVSWWPSEVDVSIRPGWFFHPEENDKVRNFENLLKIYFESVGRNAVLLLNIPPDTRGKIHENDSTELVNWGKFIEMAYSEDLLKNTFNNWSSKENEGSKESENLNIGFCVIELAEDISKGQRIEKFEIQALQDGNWNTIAEGTTIGYKRLLRIEQTQAEKIRLNITSARSGFNIKHLRLY